MYATVSGITNRLLTHVTAENPRGNSAVTAISADFAEDARCQMVGEKMRCHTLYMTEPGTWEKAIKRLMNTGHREKYRIAIHVRDLYVSWAFVGDKINLTGTFSWFRALVMIDFIHVFSFLCITHVLFTLRAITYVSGSRIRLHSTGVLQALINDLMTRKRRARYRMLIYCKGSPI